MNIFVTLMRWTLLFLSFLVAFSASAQEFDPDRLLANLRFRVASLSDAEMMIGELESSPYGNLKQGTLTINGQQTIPFLLSENMDEILLLMTSPIDVSLTELEITEERDQRAQQERLVAAESHQALTRFAEGKPSRGASDAPITIYEFSDFQCPYCARATTVIEDLLEKYPDDLRFVYLHYPLDIHDWAKPAAVAAECAARQSDSAFWMLHDNFFDLQSDISNESMFEEVRSWLEETNIDLDQWQACAADESSAANQGVSLQVDISVATAQRFGLTGTPAFFVNGYLLSGSQPMTAFEELITKVKADL